MNKIYQVVWYTGDDDEFHAKEFTNSDEAIEFSDVIECVRNAHDVKIYEYDK